MTTSARPGTRPVHEPGTHAVIPRRRAVVGAVVLVVLFVPSLAVGTGIQDAIWPQWQWGWLQQVTLGLFSVGVAILVLRPGGLRRIGLTTAPVPGSLPAMLAATVVVTALVLIPFPNPGTDFEPYGFEGYAYQATMPGLAEEIALRGVLLALLGVVFVPRWSVLGARVGWAVVVQAALFAVLHLSVGPVGLLTFFPGLVLGWMRVRSGSLWPVIIAHNIANLTAITVETLLAT
jgi:membrane protease YdiL (CAAX protease family)